MLIVKVKICGLTNYDDAVAAMDMGADLLGFNFYPSSPRYVTVEAAAAIIRKLPAFVDTAGVFVNASLDEIRRTIDLCCLDWVQLHGDETPEFCRSLNSVNVRTMKALRVKDASDIKNAEEFFTDAVLLDAFDPQKYGGTGLTFDWNIVGHIGKRVFLAGGINPDNAAEAVKLGVYGIDVCSGVEAEPGKKDHEKMKRLFDNIRYLRG
ncbi:MAG TPA: phosphoribosylanthranilate isomerase [Sedimentisphaerales bacterium]|nr:phosphoribosylanthranilate isomerase [Sedimentisphaerales bacterium]